MPTQRPLPRTGLPAGLALAGAGGLPIVGAFLGWLQVATETGGSTVITGFGSISGDTEAAGENLNEMLTIADLPSYRPGVIGLIIGILAVGIGLIVALRRPANEHPFRWPGVGVVVGGLVMSGWGLWRGFDPGSAGGVLATGDAGAGPGPWLTAIGGLLLLGVGCYLLAGRADPDVAAPRERHRGIQPG